MAQPRPTDASLRQLQHTFFASLSFLPPPPFLPSFPEVNVLSPQRRRIEKGALQRGEKEEEACVLRVCVRMEEKCVRGEARPKLLHARSAGAGGRR